MKAFSIDQHLRSVGKWVDWDNTCDGFKAGSPDTEIEGIAVAWQSTFPAIREAHNLGCNMFITHEPTFYVHMDDDDSMLKYEHVRQKKAFLERTGMVIYRCHDVWDVMPEIGIVDSWARGLGFEEKPVATQKYYGVYEFEGTVGDLAEQVRNRVSEIGQSAVQVVGELDKFVRRVGVGTGAITNVPIMVDLGADVVIATDDGISFWGWGSWAIDGDIPLVVVNHATAEEWGVKNLAIYLKATFPELRVHHIPQGCMYRML